MIKRFLKLFRKKNNTKEERRIKEQADFDRKLVFSLSKSRVPNAEQVKYIFRYLGRTEKKVFIALLFIFAISLSFLGVNFYFQNTDMVPTSGGEYVEGLIGSPQYINPILAQANDVDMDLSSLVFSGLFKYNKDHELVVDLAESYELSEDKKAYTVKIKDNIYWHDGKLFSVDDVIFTVLSIQDVFFKSPLYSSFADVGIERVDDETIRFRLNEPHSSFLEILTFGILPTHLWHSIPSQSANLAEYNIKPIGTGPFQFKSLTKDKSGNIKVYILSRNKEFYGKEPYFDKLIFKFYPDFFSATDALQNQNIEGISFLPKDAESSFKGNRIQKYYFDFPQYTALFFNQSNNAYLKDAKVRQALEFSINKEKLLNNFLGQGDKIIYSPILPWQIGFADDLEVNKFNPQKATELLEEADFELSEENFFKKEDESLKVTLTTVNREDYVGIVEEIKSDWEKIGIQTEIKIVSNIEIQNSIIKPRDYEVLIFGVMLGSAPDPYPFWHSSQVDDPGLNLSIYANRNVDKLIEEARQTSDPEVKIEKYKEFQEILAEDMPAIFLYSSSYVYAVNKEVRGVEIERVSIPSDRFIGIESWYKETKRSWK